MIILSAILITLIVLIISALITYYIFLFVEDILYQVESKKEFIKLLIPFNYWISFIYAWFIGMKEKFNNLKD